MTVVDRIAQALSTSLMHPGDGKPFPIPLMMFRTGGMKPAQLDQYAKDANLPSADIAKLVSEAIVALIETDNTIVPKAEIAQLRAAAAASEPVRNKQLELSCRCGAPMFTAEVQDFDTAHPTIYAPPVIKHMAKIHPECALGHKAI